MPWWHRLIVLGAALLVTLIVARLVDRRMARRDLPPGAVTRYRILRRSVISGIIFVGVRDNDRLVIPNDRIVSDTIRNSSIRGRKKLAQVTVQVPLDCDLDAVRGLLRDAADDDRAEVVVTALDDKARLTVSVWADDEPAAARLESELRLKAHARLREAGVFAA